MTPRRAAQYVRMSTERQNYSIEYQSVANAAFAIANGIDIVRTYSDSGISGLTLTRRPGLQALLADVMSGAAEFSLVLVYDVSRWGRFQDPDQAGHYEFVCREAGVRVEYTAEPFANDGTLAASLVKHLKRAMAAEFSRELSDKVTRTKRGLALKGYWPGGNPGLGLRRCAIGSSGDLRVPMQLGEANAIKGNRVIVVPGPEEEVRLVRRIFRQFAGAETTPNAIARRLNAEGRFPPDGRRWTQVMVRRVLQNELYGGTRVVGRAQARLGCVVRNPEGEWLRVPGAATAIVPLALFRAARRKLVRRGRWTDAQLIEALRTLLAEQGKLSHNIIARATETPSPGLYCHRFGGLQQAYDLVGYVQTPEQRRLTMRIEPLRRPRRAAPSPLSDDEVLDRIRALHQAEGRLSQELIEITPGLPRVRNLLKRFGSISGMYERAGYVPTPLQERSMQRELAKRPG